MQCRCMYLRLQDVLYFYLSWQDSTAPAKITDATQKAANGTECKKPCSNMVRSTYCCEGICE